MKLTNKIKILLLKLQRCQYQAAHGGLQSEYNNSKFERKRAWDSIDMINDKITLLENDK